MCRGGGGGGKGGRGWGALGPPLGSGASGGQPRRAGASLRPEEVGPARRVCGAEVEGEEELAHPGGIGGRGGEGEAPRSRCWEQAGGRAAEPPPTRGLRAAATRACCLRSEPRGAVCGSGRLQARVVPAGFPLLALGVGTAPGPGDGGVWPCAGRSQARLNLLLMNLFQKVQDLQLEAVSARARGRAPPASEGWGLGDGSVKGGYAYLKTNLEKKPIGIRTASLCLD